MARKIDNIVLGVNPPAPEEIEAFIVHLGYKRIEKKGKVLFRSGTGALTAPKFIQFEMGDSEVIVSSWFKYAILPFVFIFEGSSDRAPLLLRKGFKKDMEAIRDFITAEN